ncbi:MAG: hypothetical protein OEX02_15610 [Cyclobacteriaceae bacterium]|nr:hypothetical protein [Cyclobacteriaceae bacterium]
MKNEGWGADSHWVVKSIADLIAEGTDQEHDGGMARHIGTYYLWGFETLEKNSLISLLIQKSDAEQIGQLINFIWKSDKYFHQLYDDDRARNEKRIFDLGEVIEKRFHDDESKGIQKLKSRLLTLMTFVSELKKENIQLIKNTVFSLEKDYESNWFLENLVRLKDKGDSAFVTYHIGDIILHSHISTPLPGFGQKEVYELVSFMYQQKDHKDIKDLADKICNKYAEQGHDFLNGLYNENN